MDALVIGGTGFVGRHLVEALLEGGHRVTLFNRGKSNPGIYPAAEKLAGDRDGDLAALDGRNWDVVFDVSGYLPRIVRKSADKLRDHVKCYVYLSSISVYADPLHHNDEASAPLQTLENPATEYINEATYGGLKALCEQAVTEIYGERGLIARPGYIVGRYDHIARLPYLVRRFKRGGERLAGRPQQPVQLIHAGDLTDWLIRAMQDERTGVYNVTGQPVAMSALLDAVNTYTGQQNEITYTDDDFLLAENVVPGDGLTFWIPEAFDGLMRVTIEKALETGLTLRSVEAIVEDVVKWDQPEHILTDALGGNPDRALLKPEREAELLTFWHKQAK